MSELEIFWFSMSMIEAGLLIFLLGYWMGKL